MQSRKCQIEKTRKSWKILNIRNKKYKLWKGVLYFERKETHTRDEEKVLKNYIVDRNPSFALF